MADDERYERGLEMLKKVYAEDTWPRQRANTELSLDQGNTVLTGITVDGFTLTNGTEIPYGICEYDVMGAYRGKPTQVVVGKHTGLPFPANAEIVIEGRLLPEVREPEGVGIGFHQPVVHCSGFSS